MTKGLSLWWVVACVSLLAPRPCIAADLPPPPSTDKRSVTDAYHGVQVAEDFRWLEAADDPGVKAWTTAQNNWSRRYLDALPALPALRAELTRLMTSEAASYSWPTPRPGRIFALKFQPPKQQRLLVTLKSAQDPGSEHVILDPNALEPRGQVAMDWYVPSPDGSLVAVCLSENGSEEGALHFYRTNTGEALPDVIPRVQYPTAGGAVAWAPDGRAVYYTRFPRAGERPEADLNFYQQVYFHTLGTPESTDRYSIGRDFPRIAEIALETSRNGRWLVADVANGDGGEYAHYVRDLKGPADAEWRQVTRFEDGIKRVEVSVDGTLLYLRSVKDAPRGQVLRLPLDGRATLRDATVVVPQSDAVVEGITLTASYLYVTDLIGGPSRIRRFDLDGRNVRELPLPANSSANYAIPLQDRPDDNRILFLESSYLAPEAWYLYSPSSEGDGAGRAVRTAMAKASPIDFSDIEAVREFAISRDGTKVPVNILRRKDLVLDGTNPALLTAYGGYGISLRPGFDATRRAWFDRGGVIAIANLRGGGEYGEEWHLAGNLTRKQTVFDDFAACARHLIGRGYTRSERLAVEGGSNGGLLMGAFLTQNPGLARAVVSHVGIYDMLRVELDPNGAFNVTEFGTVQDPAQFQALHAYSPYHRVVDGTNYPAVFFLAGENDGRVNPAHSRKMTARLQAATASGLPILLRLSSDSGHGMGTALTERIAQEAEVLAFLFDQLGVKAEPIK